jgi:hypothetical protein
MCQQHSVFPKPDNHQNPKYEQHVTGRAIDQAIRFGTLTANAQVRYKSLQDL